MKKQYEVLEKHNSSDDWSVVFTGSYLEAVKKCASLNGEAYVSEAKEDAKIVFANKMFGK